MKRFLLKVFIVFLSICLSASISFAGGGGGGGHNQGPSANAAASANASANAKAVGINKNTNVNTNVNNNEQKQQQEQWQKQQQEQKQSQQSMNINNVEGGNNLQAGFITNVPGNVESSQSYNELSVAQIENGVSIFTTSSISAFYAGLPQCDRDIIKKIRSRFYPGQPVAASPTAETRFLHGRKMEGIEGRDYFIIGTHKFWAPPDDKDGLYVDGMTLVYMGAEEALKRNANAFTITDFGADPEARNGGGGIALMGGHSFFGGTLGYSQGWTKKQKRPFVVFKFYYVPIRIELPPVRDCYRLQRKLEDRIAEREKCTRLCLDNMITNTGIGDAYAELEKCTGDRSYLYKAAEAYERALKNYQQGYDIKKRRAEAERALATLYDHWSYTIFRLNGEAAARQFAAENNLENGFVREIR